MNKQNFQKLVTALVVTVLVMLPSIGLPQRAQAHQQRKRVVFAPAARTATATSETFSVEPETSSLTIYLAVTAVTGTTPTLDLKIQDSPDGGVTWFDVGTGTGAGTGNFVQATGATTQVKELTVRKFGRQLRVIGTLGGTNPSFTYAVHVVYS